MKEQLQRLWMALEERKEYDLSVIIGLDGNVDEIIHMVDQRLDLNNYIRILTLDDLGKRISRASGLSTNIEMVPIQVKLGGNGPIMSNAMLAYGVKLTYIGALGNPIHPVFHDMEGKAEKLYSLCKPGYTHAVCTSGFYVRNAKSPNYDEVISSLNRTLL